MRYLLDHLDTAWALTLIHLRLSLIPVALGLLIAVPLGALVWRHTALRRITTLTASIIFTIPSLAAKKARAARMAEWECRFCYQKGHLRAECPQQAAQKEAERAYIRAPPALTLGRVGLVTRRQ